MSWSLNLCALDCTHQSRSQLRVNRGISFQSSNLYSNKCMDEIYKRYNLMVDLKRYYKSISQEELQKAIQACAATKEEMESVAKQMGAAIKQPSLSDMQQQLQAYLKGYSKQNIDRRKRHGKCRFDKQGLIRRMCTYWNKPILPDTCKKCIKDNKI